MGEFDWPGKRHAKGSRAFGAGGAQKVGVSDDGGRGEGGGGFDLRRE
jgi:hypothetical protein